MTTPIGWGRGQGTMVVYGRVHQWDAGEDKPRRTLCGVKIPAPIAREALGHPSGLNTFSHWFSAPRDMHDDFYGMEPCQRCQKASRR